MFIFHSSGPFAGEMLVFFPRVYDNRCGSEILLASRGRLQYRIWPPGAAAFHRAFDA